ncbi:MAG TPA: zf-HC2 domain-containing protein [Gaiellaceae bacterium]|jgi:predicted anti-sigma-YlaC factor YlaD|nr:zf-HC2 domain-containing protein [Gaiellaceae bacterium]
MAPPSQLCERAKAWASLRTDGELSELEFALLDAHLGRCEACRAFAEGTEAVAAALRAAPLQQPVLQRVPPLALAPRRGRRTGVRALQVAAAVAVVASAGIFAALSGPSGRTAAPKPVSMVAGVDSPDRLRELRRPGLVERPAVLPRNRLVPEPI